MSAVIQSLLPIKEKGSLVAFRCAGVFPVEVCHPCPEDSVALDGLIKSGITLGAPAARPCLLPQSDTPPTAP